MENQEQNWQPISMLPMFTGMISGQLKEAKIQYESLLQAEPKPHILNDEIVARVIKVYKEQLDFIYVYENQISKWHNEETLTTKLETDLSRSQVQLQELSEVLTNILTLADKLKDGTIEKIMGKSDFELGLEFLQR